MTSDLQNNLVSETTHVRSNCHFCGYLCGLDAEVTDGRVMALSPDQTRYPYDECVIRSCQRWAKNIDALDSPERVNYPLKRVGARGSGRWKRVSWDEALDDIAARLAALAEKTGPETLATAIGGPHATFWPLHRFMNLFGSPNNMGIGQICWNPHIWTDSLTFGWPVEADIDPSRSGSVFLWGTNPAQSDNSLFWRAIIAIGKSDTPLVVVDPRRTSTAAQADLWLAPRPGTDCTLALGMVQVIIAEDLYDHAFVNRWCHGFDELKEHVASYTPQFVQDISGVPAEDVVRAARIFALSSPTALLPGRGLDQLGHNTAPTHRSLAILRAITGNVDRPGACVIAETSDFTPEIDLEMSDSLKDKQRDKQLNSAYLSLQSYEGYSKVRSLTERFARRLPMRYLTSAHPDLVWKAVLTGKPYPVRALIVMACNPLLTYADSTRVREALEELDLLVVLEYYKTPTAQLADYILPSAGALERPLFQAHGGVANIAYGGPAAVEPYYERRADYDFWRGLGLRMGQEDAWPEETLAEAFEATLAPSGMSWETFCDTGFYYVHPGYAKHEIVDQASGLPRGFATSTGKVELASEVLGSLGSERLPIPRPVHAPDCEAIDDYGMPLTLITGARFQPYYASSYFQHASFRAAHPHPFAEMSASTAKRLGVNEGDDVIVSTEKGEAAFVAHIITMVDDVVSVEYGWWFPEEGEGTPSLSGMWRSNANVLTSADIETSDHLIGTWSYNDIPCRLRRAKHVNRNQDTRQKDMAENEMAGRAR